MILVVLPLVVKESFDVLLEPNIDSFVVIELEEEAEELRKVLAIVEILLTQLELIEDPDEVAHYV